GTDTKTITFRARTSEINADNYATVSTTAGFPTDTITLENFNQEVTRTIRYVISDGKVTPPEAPEVQRVRFSASARYNHVTKQLEDIVWTPGNARFEAIKSPEVVDYVPTHTTVASVSVQPESEDINLVVTYSPRNSFFEWFRETVGDVDGDLDIDMGDVRTWLKGDKGDAGHNGQDGASGKPLSVSTSKVDKTTTVKFYYDDNNNQQLDEGEQVVHTSTIQDGQDGVAGPNGTPGRDGASGKPLSVSTSKVDKTTTVKFYYDDNNNQRLD
ncbi:TPA: hypothetical protein ACGO24_002137, partial [Streptococcus suis]